MPKGRWDEDKFKDLYESVLKEANRIENEKKNINPITCVVGEVEALSNSLNELGYDLVEDVSLRDGNKRVYNIVKKEEIKK